MAIAQAPEEERDARREHQAGENRADDGCAHHVEVAGLAPTTAMINCGAVQVTALK